MKTIQIRALADGTPEVLLYDVIGEAGSSAREVVQALATLPPAPVVRIRINSPGGDVVDGFAIYNALRGLGRTIEVQIDGLAASAASLIAMAGDDIAIARNALVMIHEPWAVTMGDAAAHRAQADLLEKMRAPFVAAYTRRSQMTPAEVEAAMAAETWFTATEAIAAGLADRLLAESAPAPIAALGRERPKAAELIRAFAAIPTMAAPAATTTEQPMIPTTLVHALGLAPEAAEADVQAAVARLSAGAVALAKLEEAVGASGDAAIGVVAALRSAAAAHDALVAQVAELRAEKEAAAKASLIERGKADGKLVPATLAWAEAQPIETLEAFLAVAPRIVPEPAKQPAVSASTSKPFAAMSPDEKARLHRSNPDLYAALRDAHASGNPTI